VEAKKREGKKPVVGKQNLSNPLQCGTSWAKGNKKGGETKRRRGKKGVVRREVKGKQRIRDPWHLI